MTDMKFPPILFRILRRDFEDHYTMSKLKQLDINLPLDLEKSSVVARRYESKVKLRQSYHLGHFSVLEEEDERFSTMRLHNQSILRELYSPEYSSALLKRNESKRSHSMKNHSIETTETYHFGGDL